MAFEFFFGIFGLISSDSSSRQKSRLDGDWRLFTPLGASLFRDTSKSPSSAGSPASFKSSSDLQRPIFSTTGTLATANNSGKFRQLFSGFEIQLMLIEHQTVTKASLSGEGVFSSTSSSSASSIASSGSGSTVASTATLIKTGPLDIMDSMTGKKSPLMSEKADSGIEDNEKLAGETNEVEEVESTKSTNGKRLRVVYCRLVCLCLWVHVLRVMAGLIVEKSLLTLDFHYLGSSRIHFLIPALCLAIQAASVSLIFIRNNDETNWLVPFYSSKDYLIRSRSNFRPKIEDYTRRVNISVGLSLVLALVSSVSLSAYLVHCVLQSEAMKGMLDMWTGGGGGTTSEVVSVTAATTTGSGAAAGISPNLELERAVLSVLVVYDILWAIYSTYICFLVSFYFNLICSIMKSRFHGISKIIEDLTESNTTKTTNQARKITTLYLEHNEACELLDESNDFWQYLIFFTYFTYIPAYCYCLYNLFFVDFEAWPSFITWVIHTHTGFIILLISFSAAGVSTEVSIENILQVSLQLVV